MLPAFNRALNAQGFVEGQNVSVVYRSDLVGRGAAVIVAVESKPGPTVNWPGLGFYTSLARMLNEKPVEPRDLEMMGMLLPLGIEKGKDFKPEGGMIRELKSAAQEAHVWLATDRFWPDGKWVIPTPPIGVTTLLRSPKRTVLMCSGFLWKPGPTACLPGKLRSH
jgi:hypothetical protein